MKAIIALFVLLFLVLIGIVVAQNYISKNPSFLLKNTATVTIKDTKFKVEVAKEPKDRETGFSGRNSLSDKNGMIFKFDHPDYYSFWMKSMKFPLDIIFISNDKVVTIYKNLEAPSKDNESLRTYQPTAPSDIVLEINAGLSDKYGIKEGDKVKIENLGADK